GLFDDPWLGLLFNGTSGTSLSNGCEVPLQQATPLGFGCCLVLRCFLRPFGGVAGRIRMRARAGELALVNDEILGADRLLGEIALEDLASAGGIARLRRQRAARDMRGHAVMRHGAPGMIARRRLREPHVAGIASELAALERAHNR